MHAMVMSAPKTALKMQDLPTPKPASGQVLLKVSTCGVCRTDLHIIDGDLKEPKLPLIIGHEIVGTVCDIGPGVVDFQTGQKVAVPWLGETCGQCRFCKTDRENLCDRAIFTGYQRNGGYATYTVANAKYCFLLPDGINDVEAAPLLCAGLIGWRTLKLAGAAVRLGIYGFGAAAHIITQVAVYQKRQIFAFTKPGDTDGQQFARSLGASWAGGSDQLPPEKLDAALVFAPVGALMVAALKAVDKGGVVVSGGIHMSDIPAFSYDLLWQERSMRSVANLTRQDAHEFLDIAFKIPVRTTTKAYPLAAANQALADLRAGHVRGAAVLVAD